MTVLLFAPAGRSFLLCVNAAWAYYKRHKPYGQRTNCLRDIASGTASGAGAVMRVFRARSGVESRLVLRGYTFTSQALKRACGVSCGVKLSYVSGSERAICQGACCGGAVRCVPVPDCFNLVRGSRKTGGRSEMHNRISFSLSRLLPGFMYCNRG